MRAGFVASLFVVASVAGCDDGLSLAKAPSEDASEPSVTLEPDPSDAGARPESAGWSIAVVQTEVSLTAGASEPIVVDVVRSDFDATEVELSMTGLAAGISATSAHVAADVDTGTLVLSAMDAAAQELSQPTIEARGSDGKVVRLVLDLTVRGAPGRLDTSAGGGVQELGAGRSSDIALSVAKQPDGRLLVAGLSSSGLRHRVVVARFNDNGDLDWSFGDVGLASAPDDERWNRARVADVHLLDDGSILLLLEGMHVVRFTREGQLDGAFGTSGVAAVTFDGQVASSGALAVQPDGRIVVVGRVERSDGSQPSHIALARLSTNGALDPSFGNGGRVVTAFADGSAGGAEDVALRLAEDGGLAGIVVAGFSRAEATDVALVGYLPSGALDASFGTLGTTTLRPGGKPSAGHRVVARGASAWVLCEPIAEAEPATVVRLVNGLVDPTFVPTSLALNPSMLARSIALDAMGRLLVAGEELPAQSGVSTRWFVQRLSGDGSLDGAFATEGIARASFKGTDDRLSAVLASADGTVAAVGTTLFAENRDFAVVELDSNGAPVAAFGNGGQKRKNLAGGDDLIFAAVMQSDGSILATGASFGGDTWKTLIFQIANPGNSSARFAYDDTPLTAAGDGPDGPRSLARAILTQPDKKVVVGSFGEANALARFQPEGAFDTSFGVNGIATAGTNTVRAMGLQHNGRIVIAGSTPNGVAALSRFGADGTPDASFGSSGTAGTVLVDFGLGRQSLSAVTVDAKDAILFAGHRELSNTRAWLVGRLLPSGLPDPSFDGDGRLVQTLGSDAVASAVLVHPLGGILVGGTENGSGTSTFTLARYTSGGKLDTTFGTNGLGRIALGGAPELAGLALSPALDLIGVGTVMTPAPSLAVMRWKKDGTPDPTFGRSGGGTSDSFGALESHGRAVVMTSGERMLVFGTTRSHFDQNILVARFWR
ncbi:hypothetical protein [Labilithrix luteola]|uniref:hypothetical protein n=1 Tax=Labilithrix luteola TaxID=1391654 RepID=UPI0014764757|nr:hypothetical protein [Labilithrix luteola]